INSGTDFVQYGNIVNIEHKKGKDKWSIFNTLYNFIKNNKLYISVFSIAGICWYIINNYYSLLGSDILSNTVEQINNIIPFKNSPVENFENFEIQKSILYCELLNYQQERVFGNS